MIVSLRCLGWEASQWSTRPLACLLRRCVTALALASVASLVPATSAHADCAGTARPPAGTNNLWYCQNNSPVAVVFVHGLHSDSRESWYFDNVAGQRDGNAATAAAGEGGAYWPEIVRQDPRLEHPSIYLGGFPTQLDSADFGIRDASELFMAMLRTDPGGGPSPLDKDTIIFVAHSLGGIVVRDLLLRHTAAFRGKRIGLMLIASPSYGSRDADALTPAMKISGHRMGEQLRWASDFLRTLDQDFASLLQRQEELPVLVGRELYEQFPLSSASFAKFLPATAANLLARSMSVPVVERQSAVRYFEPGVMIFGSDHISIAKPDGPAHRSHGQLIEIYEALKSKARPGCTAPPHFKLELDVLTGDHSLIEPKMQDLIDTPLPLLTLRRLDEARRPLRGTGKAFAVRNPVSSFHEWAPPQPFPCPGEMFRAVFQRSPDTASLQSGGQPPRTELCFRRSRVAADRPNALIRCIEGAECGIDQAAPGLAEPCEQQGRAPFGLGFIATAHAQTRSPVIGGAATPDSYWSVPSLEAMAALPQERRSGFTEFSLWSEPLQGLDAARSASFGISVNGIPIHFDDWPPHADSVGYDPNSGFRLSIGIGNLGFTGGADGLEHLKVDLRFYDETGNQLKAVELERDYVSYRHAAERALETSLGTVHWQGWYRPAAFTDRAEVMLAVATDLKGIQESKRLVDSRGVLYGGLPLIGVIRPPREDNKKAYGLVMGLKLPNGQVRSTFALEESKAVCRWVLGRAGPKPFPAWVAKGAYLYEFTTKTITEQSDRGRYLDLCSKVE